MTACAVIALVLSFGMLRGGLASGTSLLRWHLLACAVGLALAALAVSGIGAWVDAAGGLLLGGMALGSSVVLGRIGGRTGRAATGPVSIAPIAVGLGLTALAVLVMRRETEALALAVALLGVFSASRPGPPALVLAHVVALGDGLGLAAAAAHDWRLTAASVLLAPSALLVAAAR